MDDAPNFSGSYPLAGKLIGPAWREIWRVLHEEQGRAVERRPLAEHVARLCGVVPGTAEGLMWKAGRLGLIKVTYSMATGRRVAYVARARRCCR